MSDRINWTEPMDRQLRQFYFEGAYTSEAVGGLLGVSGKAVRARAARLRRGHPEIRVRKPAVRSPRPPKPAAEPLNTHRAPVNFKAVEKPAQPLPERIAAELRLCPLSAPSLASMLGEKEIYVSMQLAAMAHDGSVQAGPACKLGNRHRLWRMVA